MDNKEFGKQLEKRTRAFAVQIIQLAGILPKTTEGRVVRNQIARSGTSIGANYREANRSRSKNDFQYRIKICESEASETQYWLELISDLNWLKPEVIQPIYRECSELLAIFTSIGKKASA